MGKLMKSFAALLDQKFLKKNGKKKKTRKNKRKKIFHFGFFFQDVEKPVNSTLFENKKNIVFSFKFTGFSTSSKKISVFFLFFFFHFFFFFFFSNFVSSFEQEITRYERFCGVSWSTEGGPTA